MEIIGALKKTTSPATVYFCSYEGRGFGWKDIVGLLNQSAMGREISHKLSEKAVRCIAIESIDEMQTDKRLVGAVFKRGTGDYISIAAPHYQDLDVYFTDIVGFPAPAVSAY